MFKNIVVVGDFSTTKMLKISVVSYKWFGFSDSLLFRNYLIYS